MSTSAHTHDHDNDHEEHDHRHGLFQDHVHAPTYESLDTAEGVKAMKWSFVWLFIAATLQLFLALLSGSTALLADCIHNFADAGTAVPLWAAFRAGKRPPTNRFPYGLHHAEDLAGGMILLIIFSSALVAAGESVLRFFFPQLITLLWGVVLVAVMGAGANAIAAALRITTGKKIQSAPLEADGYHALSDVLASLAVLLGPLFVWLGYPRMDPIVGFLISLVIVRISWKSAWVIIPRMLGGVDDPNLVPSITHTIQHVSGVIEVVEVRGRWLGRKLMGDAKIIIAPTLTADEQTSIVKEIRHQLGHMDVFHNQDLTSNFAIEVTFPSSK